MSPATVGQRRHQVLIQTPGPAVPDGDGGYTQTWSDLASEWAEVKPATVRDLERITSSTVISTASHLVTIPYVAGVTTKARVVFNGRILNVTGVSNPEEKNVSLELICVEVVP